MRVLRLVRFCLHPACMLSLANTAFAATGSLNSSRVSSVCVASCYQTNEWMVLLFLSFFILFLYAAIVVIERCMTYISVKKGSRIFSQKVALALSAGHLQEAINISKAYASCPLAKALTEILQIKNTTAEKDFDAEAFQVAARNYTSAECEEELNNNLEGLKRAGEAALILGGIGTGIELLNTIASLRFMGYGDEFLSVFVWRLSDSFSLFICSLFIAVPCLWVHKRLVKKAKSLLDDIETESWQLIHRLVNLPKNKIRRAKKLAQAEPAAISEAARPVLEQQLFSNFTSQ